MSKILKEIVDSSITVDVASILSAYEHAFNIINVNIEDYDWSLVTFKYLDSERVMRNICAENLVEALIERCLLPEGTTFLESNEKGFIVEMKEKDEPLLDYLSDLIKIEIKCK
jgi:hypothetical protein